jgi:hypothetical protein
VTILVILIVIIALIESGRRGHRRYRRRAGLTIRETIPVGRRSWITFGKRFRQ